MGKQSIFSKIKQLIAGISFKIFLWGSNLTQDRYLQIRYEEALLDKVEPKQVKVKGCEWCGGSFSEIRGRYPKEPRRLVCPTCLQEKLEASEESTPQQAARYP